MTKIDIGRSSQRVAVYIAMDAECDDFALQGHIQAFLRGVSCISPYRRMFDGLHKAARRSGSTLLDVDGNPAQIMELSEPEFMAFDYWLRDYIVERASHIARRNRPESLGRLRLHITLCRMAFPREAMSWGKSDAELGLTHTRHTPLKDLDWD